MWFEGRIALCPISLGGLLDQLRGEAVSGEAVSGEAEDADLIAPPGRHGESTVEESIEQQSGKGKGSGVKRRVVRDEDGNVRTPIQQRQNVSTGATSSTVPTLDPQYIQ